MASLQKATPEELPALLERLTTKLPHSFTVHGVVSGQLSHGLDRWKIIVSPAPSTLVIVTRSSLSLQSVSLYWDVDEDQETLTKMLASTTLINWTQRIVLFACTPYVIRKMDEMIRTGVLGGGKLIPDPVIDAHVYTITQAILPSASPRLPEGLRIGPVEPHHAHVLFKHWEYNQLENIEEYTEMVKALPGYAVYPCPSPHTTESTEDSALEDTEQPIAWAQFSPHNTIQNTFTLEKYRRMGLGKAVTLALVTHLLREGTSASLIIVDKNEPSIRFHEGLGFVRETPVMFLVCSVLG
ncbi:hypothetical protein OTU49_015566, partial [Cherax quadricarinatus]